MRLSITFKILIDRSLASLQEFVVGCPSASVAFCRLVSSPYGAETYFLCGNFLPATAWP